MGQVISVVQQKGGVGKSTTLCSIAAWHAKDGAKVAIIDTDPQRTCEHWAEKQEVGVDVLYEDNDEQLAPAVQQLSERYDLVLIDTAGYKSAMAMYAIALSDLVLIPTKAAEPDAAGAVRTWKHVNSVAMTSAKKAKPYIFLTDVDKRANITQAIKSVIEAQGAELISTPLWSLTGFKEMHSTGGLPTGSAYTALRQFIGNLQGRGLLSFYAPQEEYAHG